MKYIFLFYLLFLSHLFADIPIITNFDKAVDIAQKEKKYIFADFTGSDWCIWCKKLKSEVVNTDEFEEFVAKNLIYLQFDFPKSVPQPKKVKEYNKSYLELYGIQGFPTILVLDKNGKLIGRTGYREGGVKAYIKHIEDILNR